MDVCHLYKSVHFTRLGSSLVSRKCGHCFPDPSWSLETSLVRTETVGQFLPSSSIQPSFTTFQPGHGVTTQSWDIIHDLEARGPFFDSIHSLRSKSNPEEL
uniref:Uncharacterized protein n=1 Tax=Cacopsylla melanoneura TaxID=428564 RepID=A0A8D8WZX0_9HEMI